MTGNRNQSTEETGAPAVNDEWDKNTAEAIGIAEEEQQQGTPDRLKGYSFKASEELYHALREIVPEGSLSSAMRIAGGRQLELTRLCGATP